MHAAADAAVTDTGPSSDEFEIRADRQPTLRWPLPSGVGVAILPVNLILRCPWRPANEIGTQQPIIKQTTIGAAPQPALQTSHQIGPETLWKRL
jgi:hypothetical protein